MTDLPAIIPQELDIEYVRGIPELRPGTARPKTKVLAALALDRREGRPTHGRRGAPATFFGCSAHLGWKVPDDFDDPNDQIADLFEGDPPHP